MQVLKRPSDDGINLTWRSYTPNSDDFVFIVGGGTEFYGYEDIDRARPHNPQDFEDLMNAMEN